MPELTQTIDTHNDELILDITDSLTITSTTYVDPLLLTASQIDDILHNYEVQ